MRIDDIASLITVATGFASVLLAFAIHWVSKYYETKNRRIELNHSYKLGLYSKFFKYINELILGVHKSEETENKELAEIRNIISTSLFLIEDNIRCDMVDLLAYVTQEKFDTKTACLMIDKLCKKIKPEFK